MLKIKVSTKESAEVTHTVHFRESDLVNIIEDNNGILIINIKDEFKINGIATLFTREPIKLSEYSSLIEVKEKTIVEHRNAGLFERKQGGEAVIDKEVKKEGFAPFTNLVKQIEELKQRLDKLENK